LLTIPYNFNPRPYQLPVLKALDSGIKRVVAVWHRRAGKEKTFINYVAKACFQRVGTYFYLFPTYTQAKKVLWDGRDREGFPFMGHFPREIVKAKNETELRVELINGSSVQLVGSDNIDSIVGTNPLGCVFSEYAVQDPRAWDYMRPILRENGGWSIFDFTPRGKNHGYSLYQMARSNKDWYAEVLTCDDTHAISQSDIDKERAEGMSEELIQQEFYCSFEGVMFGAYFGKQLQKAEAEKRITAVPYEEGLGVETWWDLGIGDSTVIWFTQSHGREIRVIDYYEASGEGLPHYAKVLQNRPYIYSKHHAPHDIEVRELGSGRSRKETAASLGLVFETVPNLPVEDGIEAARSILSRCWFDKEKCAKGLNALASYHKAFDDKAKDWKSYPAHDWSSHAADAFRYLAVGHKTTPVKTKEPDIQIMSYDQGAASVSWLAT
jgi:phage terminase large subunit